ncbi:MAG: DEAD/DEAH box helicase [Candidatus Thorarchaeota archaeon]|nr:DEAD/DEAH box helicase [Candidatus Thorarchaeota archaeon]
MTQIAVKYDRGTIVVTGIERVPFGSWDARSKCFRAEGMRYQEIVDYLKRRGVVYSDGVLDVPEVPTMRADIKLRDYQQQALEAWEELRRGVVELPTGSGKSFVALRAIADLAVPTLIVVPTIDLMNQWKRWGGEHLGVEAGMVGGGEHSVMPITIATYDSAAIHAEHLGNRFLLLVFDEVHHLPAPSFQQIAEMFVAPYRLGLTATYEREDGAHLELPRLIGGLVYRRAADDLAGKHLSPYVHERVLIDLLPAERETYDREWNTFKAYVRSSGMSMRGVADFKRFIMRTGTDPAARKALIARNRAIDTALNSEAKMQVLVDLLETYPEEKTMLFTRHNDLVYRISSRFLIPAITHQTDKEERNRILDRFRSGQYRVIVTSQVLDEGIDVPDASIAVIISGTGSSREYVQRLGRILRKREGKTARIFELVSKDTLESRMSSRRHR